MEKLKFNLKSTLLSLIVIVISFMSCNRQENLTFQDFDKNDDTKIDLMEFQQVFTANYYDDWNLQDDLYLDDEDFLTGTYQAFDVDDDEQLTEQEWMEGLRYSYGHHVVTDFDDLDADADDFISYDEYEEALINTSYYASWDIDNDNHLSEKELAAGIFYVWDINQSDFIEPDEYEKFDYYYLDI